MYRISGIIAIAILLTLSQLPNTNAAGKFFTQKFSYPPEQVIYSSTGSKDDTLVYAVCNEEVSTAEKTCTIIQRQYPYDKVVHSCNVTLRVKHLENTNLTELNVRTFGRENGILFWGEHGSRNTFNLMAIQLNRCKLKMLELDDPIKDIYLQSISGYKIMPYVKYLDMFIEHMTQKNESSDIQTGIRIHFDSKPQPIYNIIRNLTDAKIWFILSIDKNSPDKGFVYAIVAKNETECLMLVKPNGSEKLLTSCECHIKMSSINNNIISLCVGAINDTRTTCSQYDENGEIKFNVTLKISDDDKRAILPVSMHTTPGGGFLITTRTYEKFEGKIDYTKIIGFDLLRIDSTGTQVGSVRLNGLVKAGSIPKAYTVWENGNEYCATSVAQILPGNDIEYTVNCFAESDFLA